MSPFDRSYIGRLVTEASTPKGRQSAQASRKASQRVDAMRASDQPRLRLLASGSIPGIGHPADHAKAGRILKASNL